jgi:hypothetical protein
VAPASLGVVIEDTSIVQFAHDAGRWLEHLLMDTAWYATSSVLGLALGLYFGRLLTAVIVHWESTKTVSRVSVALVTFLLGGAGGTALFEGVLEAPTGVLYMGGLAVGMIVAFFRPRLPAQYTIETVLQVVRMSEALRDEVPDVEERALLILAPLVPPKQIQRDSKMNEGQLARDLEAAADKFPDINAEAENQDSPEQDLQEPDENSEEPDRD